MIGGGANRARLRALGLTMGLAAVLAAAPRAAADEDPCVADARKYCPGKVGSELESCLRGKATRTSPACRATIEAPDTSPDAATVLRSISLEPCREDFRLLCPDLPGGSRREDIVACLKAKELSLSRECGDALAGATVPKRAKGGRTGYSVPPR